MAKKLFYRKDWEVAADCNLLQRQTGIHLGCIDNMWGGRGGEEVNCSLSSAGTLAEEVHPVLSAWLWKGGEQIRQLVTESAIYSSLVNT